MPVFSKEEDLLFSEIRSTFHLSFLTPLGIGEKYGRDGPGGGRADGIESPKGSVVLMF